MKALSPLAILLSALLLQGCVAAAVVGTAAVGTKAATDPRTVGTQVDDSTLEVDLIVPSTWLRWVNKGTRFEFDVDELGRSYTAQVDRLGAKVDAVSQTIKITGSFVDRPGNVLTGMSGTAKFTPPTN